MTKKYSIRITEEELVKTRSILMADHPKENAAFLLAGVKEVDFTTELIVRRIVEIPKSEYRIKDDYYLEISPKAINGLISLCEANGLGVILCHSHPTEDIPYSETDDMGEERIAQFLWKFMPQALVGSLLFTKDDHYGRVWIPDGVHGTVSSISSMTVVGRHLQKLSLNNEQESLNSNEGDIYDRQILAFGKKGQKIISSTKVGIVGVGGTGSPTAEMIVRMGVKDIVLIDKDDFDPSNLTRVYGSTFFDVSSGLKIAKVDLVGNHLKEIMPDLKVKKIKDNVVNYDACKALLDRDVIFCCTDEHWGRSIVNQLSYQYLIPVINMGFRIDSEKGKIKEAGSSVHLLRPGKPCLWCSNFLNADRIRTESLPVNERDSLLREGYVENIDTPAPSVIPFTTAISAHAVTLFLQLLTDFMGDNGDLSCQNHYIMYGELRRGKREVKQNCICQKVKGYGDLKQLPTIKEMKTQNLEIKCG